MSRMADLDIAARENVVAVASAQPIHQKRPWWYTSPVRPNGVSSVSLVWADWDYVIKSGNLSGVLLVARHECRPSSAPRFSCQTH